MSVATLRPLRGTFAALYTPFTPTGDVDMPALRALAERLVAAGVGLVPCGTTGETPTLSPDEVRQVIGLAVEVAGGRVPVIAGAGSNSTAHTIHNTRQALEAGADAALVVTPYYNKPPPASLLAHFRAVADEGGLPVVLYNVPGRTSCNLTARTALELAAHPRVIGIKEAAANLDQLQLLLAEAPPDFAVLSGDDAWTLPLVLLGGQGVISVAANVVPEAMVALVDAAQAGDLELARQLQRRLLPLFRALFLTTNPIPVKRAAALLGQARAQMRLPLTADAMDQPMVAELEAALRRAEPAVAP